MNSCHKSMLTTSQNGPVNNRSAILVAERILHTLSEITTVIEEHYDLIVLVTSSIIRSSNVCDSYYLFNWSEKADAYNLVGLLISCTRCPTKVTFGPKTGWPRHRLTGNLDVNLISR